MKSVFQIVHLWILVSVASVLAGKAKRSYVSNYFKYCQEEDKSTCHVIVDMVVLELLSSFRTSTRTKIFRTLVPELVLELKLWNFSSRTSTRTKIFGTHSSRTSTRTKIFGSVVPELVLELKIVRTLF